MKNGSEGRGRLLSSFLAYLVSFFILIGFAIAFLAALSLSLSALL